MHNSYRKLPLSDFNSCNWNIRPRHCENTGMSECISQIKWEWTPSLIISHPIFSLRFLCDYCLLAVRGSFCPISLVPGPWGPSIKIKNTFLWKPNRSDKLQTAPWMPYRDILQHKNLAIRPPQAKHKRWANTLGGESMVRTDKCQGAPGLLLANI